MKVSIVIDNFNYERFLGEAIESALAQTHADVEIVVVDDGSTDGSREVIASYGDRVLAVLKDNGGQASAFNAGFAACTGEVVIFLDADDVLEPEAAGRAAAALADPAVAKVHWPLEEIDAEGRPSGRRKPRHALLEGDLRDMMLREGITDERSPPTSGNAFARAFLERVLPMPEPPFRACADSYILRLALVAGRVVAIDEPLARYRVHGENEYAGLIGIERHRRLLECYDLLCGAIGDMSGMPPEQIASADDRHRWMKRLEVVTRELPEVVPADQRMIVIDDDDWGAQWERPGVVAGRAAVPFLERDGTWWGRPSDDAEAVAELGRLRADGARFVVVGWAAFWWLDHYGGLAAYLDDHAQ